MLCVSVFSLLQWDETHETYVIGFLDQPESWWEINSTIKRIALQNHQRDYSCGQGRTEINRKEPRLTWAPV